MRRTTVHVVLMALSCAALAGAPARAEEIVTTKGTIKKVEVEGEKVTILVANNGAADDLIWFHVVKGKPVTRAGKKAKSSDLKVGQGVAIRSKNIQLDSDPPQMYAESVVIETDPKK